MVRRRYFNGTQVKNVGEYGQEESGWIHVSVDGQEGYMMAEYLVCIYYGGEPSLRGHG